VAKKPHDTLVRETNDARKNNTRVIISGKLKRLEPLSIITAVLTYKT